MTIPKMPENVKIGPHVIPIAEAPDSLDCFGQYTYDPPMILMREGGVQSQRADTLLHEILHGIWKDAQLVRLMEIKDIDDREESMVRVLATQLIGVLRENPKLVKYLTAE